jgi:uncharacterized membrane protein
MTYSERHIEDRIVWLLISLYILCFGYITFLKYRSFGYQDFDLAIYSQVFWNILHGSIRSSILGIDFLGNHASFILFLLVPAYLVFKSSLTLLSVQSIALGIAAYPLYLVAKKELGRGVGLVIAFIYLIYPALGYINLFEFHPTALAVPCLFFMYYYFEKKDFKMFVVSMILSLICQENIALIIMLFGVYVFFARRDIAWASTAFLAGTLWFYIMVFKVIPYFNKDTINFMSIYSHMGNSMPEILRFIMLRPAETMKIMFAWPKILYLIKIFLPVSFLPIFDFKILIAMPIFIQHFLSARQTEYNINYHYTAELIPFIFISTIYGLKRVLAVMYFKSSQLKNFFILFILSISLISSFSFGSQLKLPTYSKDFKKDLWDHEKENFIKMVPDKAGVVSTFEFLPMLSKRERLYSFHHIVMGLYTLSSKPYSLPEDAEYGLLDFNDFLTFRSFYTCGRSEINMRKFISAGNWGVVDMAGSIVLLKKNYSGNYRLYSVFDKMPEVLHMGSVLIDDNLEFLGYNSLLEDKDGKGQLKLTLFWSISGDIKKYYGNFIDILDLKENVRYGFEKPICYRIYPSYFWQKGEVVSEDYIIPIPGDIGSSYSVKMGVFDCRTGIYCGMYSDNEKLIYKGTMINLFDK